MDGAFEITEELVEFGGIFGDESELHSDALQNVDENEGGGGSLELDPIGASGESEDNGGLLLPDGDDGVEQEGLGGASFKDEERPAEVGDPTGYGELVAKTAV